MTSSNKKILAVAGAAVAALIVLAMLFPCTACVGDGARAAMTRSIMQNFEAGCRQYKAEYGAFPAGDAKAVTAALAGKNPGGEVFFYLSKEGLSDGGEPLDAWSKPLRLIRTNNEIPQLVSAGADKVFGTKDDITSRSP